MKFFHLVIIFAKALLKNMPSKALKVDIGRIFFCLKYFSFQVHLRILNSLHKYYHIIKFPDFEM